MSTRVWVSEDGHYYAVLCKEGTVNYDVIACDFSGAWLSHRYCPTGWEDTDVRYTHAEFPQMITSWTNHGRWTRGRTRYRKAFSMTFIDVRQDVPLLPFSQRSADVQPYLARYEATFRTQRRVSRAVWAQIQARIAQTAAQQVGAGKALREGEEEGA